MLTLQSLLLLISTLSFSEIRFWFVDLSLIVLFVSLTTQREHIADALISLIKKKG